MQSVFISHSVDDAAFVSRLVDDLRDRDFEARSFSDVIPDGEALSKTDLDIRLGRAIAEDTFFVTVLTPAAVASPWIHKELAIATDSESRFDTVKVLPILTKPCILPPVLGLRSPVDFTHSYEQGLAGLLALLAPPDSTASAVGVDLYLPGSEPIVWQLCQELRRPTVNLFDLSEPQFERLIAEMLRTLGFHVQLTHRSNDAGIDVIALSTWNPQRVPLYFQCKRYAPNRQVTLECVDSLTASASLPGTAHGLLVASAAGFAVNDHPSGRTRWRTRSTYSIDRARWTDLFSWLARSSGVDTHLRDRVQAAREHHAALTDKRFASALDGAEIQELRQLEFLLDAADAPYYEPIKERLRAVRDDLLRGVNETAENN